MITLIGLLLLLRLRFLQGSCLWWWMLLRLLGHNILLLLFLPLALLSLPRTSAQCLSSRGCLCCYIRQWRWVVITPRRLCHCRMMLLCTTRSSSRSRSGATATDGGSIHGLITVSIATIITVATARRATAPRGGGDHSALRCVSYLQEMNQTTIS